MGLPARTPENCPPGLEYLTSIDQLLVHQQVEMLEGIRNKTLQALETISYFHKRLLFVKRFC